ncbi:MAG: 50S ribosomal protein L11 methyltransferase [Bacteroidota bacterium]|nr:50S ribosomal protein L11 methyltransferase [Bacteroidota bacterium]
MPQNQFLEIQFQLLPEFQEIVIAELSELDFDSFWETEQGFSGYIFAHLYSELRLAELIEKYKAANITYEILTLENKNWNEEWEKNFEPIIIDDKCYIRAAFHKPRPEIPLEIVIDPKMSFGTGHHATTYMMVQQLFALDLKNKTVMDAGTGSGILAIVASKLGASEILAFDTDDWAVENSIENTSKNNCTNITVSQGTINECVPEGKKYDVILANITKNILTSESASYMESLQADGYLIISGFYTEDVKDLTSTFGGLQVVNTIERDNWASVIFQLKN